MPAATNTLDGATVWFEDDGGHGEPVVIQGGFLDPIGLVRRAPIAEALQRLGDAYRPVFVDHRGHGRSEKPHDPAASADGSGAMGISASPRFDGARHGSTRPKPSDARCTRPCRGRLTRPFDPRSTGCAFAERIVGHPFGRSATMATVRCANCGTEFDDDEGVCPVCGMGVEAVGIEEPGGG